MNTLLKLALATAIALPSTVLAHATIGVFDLRRAVFQTEAWEIELAQAEQRFVEEQQTVDQLRAELEELFADLETNAPTMSQNELERMREEGQFKQLRIQQIGERVRASLQETQNNFLERYRTLLGEALNEVYEEGEYDIILRAESVVVSGFTLDVTPALTAKLNDLIAAND